MNFLSRRALLAMTVLSLGVAAGCGAVTQPDPGLTVTASVSAATLANDCGSATSRRTSGVWAGDCAATDAGIGAESCGGFCQQSNMQIAFDASAGEGSGWAGAGQEDFMKVTAREGSMKIAGQRRKGYVIEFSLMDHYHAKAFFTEAGELAIVELPEGYRAVEPVIHGLVPDEPDEGN